MGNPNFFYILACPFRADKWMDDTEGDALGYNGSGRWPESADVNLNCYIAKKNTVRFWQEIFNRDGKLTARHEKFPFDSGHKNV